MALCNVTKCKYDGLCSAVDEMLLEATTAAGDNIADHVGTRLVYKI